MNISSIDSWFTVIVVLYAVIMAGVGLLIAWKRNWKLGIVRFGVTVVAALAALPLARVLAAGLTDSIYDLVESKLEGKVSDFVNAVPIGSEGIRVLIALLVAPLLYFLVFIALRALASIAVAILGAVVPPLRHKQNLPLTLSLGAVNGLAIALVTLIPLCGFMVLCGRGVGAVVDSGMTQTELVQDKVMNQLNLTEDDLTELSDTLESNPAVTVVYATVGKPAFTYLTSSELEPAGGQGAADKDTLAARSSGLVPLAVQGANGRPSVVFVAEKSASATVIEMNLEQELCSIVQTVGSVMKAVDCFSSENFTEADKEVLLAAVDSIFTADSAWVQMVASDALVSFSNSWLEGEAFLGIEAPELDEMINPLFTCMLEVLATGSTETLHEDVRIVADVVGDLLVNDVFAGGVDPNEMMNRLTQDGLLTKVMEKLRANPRMEAVAQEVQSVGVRVVSKMLNLDKLKNGEYDDMLARVAEECNKVLHLDPAERRETAARELSKALNEHGFEVSETVALELADKLIVDLGDDNEVTVEELKDYLIDIAEGRVELPDEILPDGEL